MHYLLAVVEGETEKALIEAFRKIKVGQSPESYGAIEVVPIPANGNQGYTRLVEVARQKIDEYLKNPDNCFDQSDDSVEKWLVFDYDDIENKQITINELRSKIKEAGFACAISRPNVEFFILSLLKGTGYAKNINPENYKQEINRAIGVLNNRDAVEKPGFGNAIKIPPYNKKIYQCRSCLLAIFAFHPELLDDVLRNNEHHDDDERYSEIPDLLLRILEVIRR